MDKIYLSLFLLLLLNACSQGSEAEKEPEAQARDTLVLKDTLRIQKRDTILKDAKQVLISADKMNVLYVGVENPLTITAEGLSPEELNPQISGTGQGEIKKTGGNRFVVTVKEPGECLISQEKPIAFKKYFRIKRIPDPQAYLGKSTGGVMGTGEFRAQGGVLAILENFDFFAKCQTVSFDLYYVAKKQDPVHVSNRGARFNSDSRNLINRAKPGDIYFFENIRAKCPGDGNSRTINTMVFRIK